MKKHINKIIMVLAVTSACSYGQDQYTPDAEENRAFAAGEIASVELERSVDFGKDRSVAVYSRRQKQNYWIQSYYRFFDITLQVHTTFVNNNTGASKVDIKTTTTGRYLKNRNLEFQWPEKVFLNTLSDKDLRDAKDNHWGCLNAIVRMPKSCGYARVSGNNSRSLDGWRNF